MLQVTVRDQGEFDRGQSCPQARSATRLLSVINRHRGRNNW